MDIDTEAIVLQRVRSCFNSARERASVYQTYIGKIREYQIESEKIEIQIAEHLLILKRLGFTLDSPELQTTIDSSAPYLVPIVRRIFEELPR